MRKSLLLLIMLTLTLLSSCSDQATKFDESPEVKGGKFGLWLMPEEDRDKFSKIIISISDEYLTPKFEPHVTLLGDLVGFSEEEIISKVNELAESIDPYMITLTDITFPTSYTSDHEAYFRCLFILAERTEPVMNANELARKIFGRQDDPQYNPHLSIMYGPYPPRIKETIVADIGREFNTSFIAKNIYVWSDKGFPDEWKLIKKIPLGTN